MYLSREVGKSLTTFTSLHFPFAIKHKTSFPYEVTLGVGGNIGDVRRRFERLFFFFKRERRVELVKTSLILKNPPFGYMNQDDFFNSIIVLKTAMQPKEFLKYIHRVEKKFGRQRSFANAPRTLDLDILFFDNRQIDTEELTIPHAAWSKRESVVIPLAGVKK